MLPLRALLYSFWWARNWFFDVFHVEHMLSTEADKKHRQVGSTHAGYSRRSREVVWS